MREKLYVDTSEEGISCMISCEELGPGKIEIIADFEAVKELQISVTCYF